jgi:hypothetical protein
MRILADRDNCEKDNIKVKDIFRWFFGIKAFRDGVNHCLCIITMRGGPQEAG